MNSPPALMAAAQVTEAVPFFDGKIFGATQVFDEGRHVEVFHRYVDEKLEKLYHVNDNLYVIIDAIMHDGRWDMKFLGMQILIEGLALGAFGTLYKITREPLLRALLKAVIQDEARMFQRLVPNLREIGLMSPRVLARYEEVGLMRYFGGTAAHQLTTAELLADLDGALVTL